MTIVDSGTRTPQDVREAVRGLAPTIAARAAEIEAARRLPRDLLDRLVEAGCFRVLLPRSHGGLGADLAGGTRVVEALARADASTAWTVMIGGSGWVDLAGLPRPTFDALFGRPDVVVAGVFNPAGRITATAGRYRVSGRWGFASGCEHADVLYGNCVEGVVDGVPQLRMAVFTPDQVTIEDTWSTSGLRGTGSHHIRVEGVEVPAEQTLVPLAGEPCLDEPVVHIPTPALLSLMIAGVAIGTAQGALDDVVALAGDKVPLLAGAPLAEHPLFHCDLATADTELRAARALLYEEAGAAWATASGGDGFGLEQRARIRAAAVWATMRAVAVVETSHRSGGGTSVYAECPLQRRLRDIHTLAQHFLVRRDTLVTAGAVLAGQDVDVMVF